MTTTRYSYQMEIALLVSVFLHALSFGLYQTRQVWEHLPLMRPLVQLLTEPRAPAKRAEAVVPRITFVEAPAEQPPPPAVPPQPQEQRKPNIFMETHDAQATATPPPDAEYYGVRSTVAANPENPTEKMGETPYLEGKETGAMAARNVTLPQPGVMVPPAPPPAPATPPPGGARPVAPAPPEVDKPKALPEEGQAKAEPPKPEPPKVAMLVGPGGSGEKPGLATPPTPPRPQFSPGRPGGEVATVKSRLMASGVDRRGVAAFNVAESPFGAYDREIIRAVQSRWFAIINEMGVYERPGTVTLYFELYDDGRIGNLHRKENSAGELLALFCEKAVTEAAPFEPLPEKLRLLIGAQPRDVTFTFYY